MKVQDIIGRLGLQPHPEGGYFKEIYRADESVVADNLPDRYSGARSMSTSIFYLLTADTFSTMHRVKSDEMFHFYLGDPVEQLHLRQDGSSQVIHLGQNLMGDERLQSLVRRGVWQGARLIDGGKYALLGATVAPGFDFADYEEGTKEALCSQYPDMTAMICKLTRR